MRPTESVIAEPAATVAKLAHLFTALQGFWERRRLVHQLVELDDRLLRDIGLTRQDVDSVASGAYSYDPTVELAQRAHQARMSRRAAAREYLRWSNAAAEAEVAQAEVSMAKRAA